MEQETSKGPSSLDFNPSLNSSVSVTVPSTLYPGSRLRWHATLSREDYDKLCHEEINVQVWSDIVSTGEWSETTFEKHVRVDMTSSEAVEHVDLSLVDSTVIPGISNDPVSLEATVSLPPLVGRTVRYTYRLLHASGSVTWLGTEQTNGSIVVKHADGHDGLKADDWINVEHNVWQTRVKREPTVVARLSNDAKWIGWAVGEEGANRFTDVTSTMSRTVALALLPEAAPETYVSYPPIMYTSGNGTLSLADGRDVLFHAGEGESLLHVHVSTLKWKDHIPMYTKTAILDVQAADFLGLSVKSEGNVGHIHLLPVTHSPAIITLDSSDITSLVSTSSSVVLFDPLSHAVKFLSEIPPTQRLRVAVGPAGGEIQVIPRYALSAELSVALFFQDSGCIVSAEPDSTSETNSERFSSNLELTPESAHGRVGGSTDPEGHTTAPELVLLAMYLLQYLFQILLSTASSKSSRSSTPTPQDTHTESIAKPSRLVFKVTGKYTLLVECDDISRLLILVGGAPLQTLPQDIGGGHWLFENDLKTDHAQDELILSHKPHVLH